MMFNTIRNIHFIGIGGVGMSGIAEILLNSGYIISGSDVKESAATARLQKLGATITIGHTAAAVYKAEVVVVSSAINKHNPEIIEATSRKVPIIHRSEMLAELMRLKYGIIISGTHGKTTTTSLIATALATAGLDPTVMIGGRLNAIDTNAKAGQGDLFVAEADESDKSFLKLTPTIAVVTNIDKDHMDCYQSFEDILAAFETFVAKVPFYGSVCACLDDPGVQLLLPTIKRKLITFGLRPDADITAKNISLHEMTSKFTPVVFGKEYAQVTLNMPGKYNVSNALAAFAVATTLNVPLEAIGEGLSKFEGVLHRSTTIGKVKNIRIIDDYAHNPKKISTCLNGLRESFPQAHLCAIFQPHRYSRIRLLQNEFSQSFSQADSVIITPIYSAGETNPTGITQESIGALISHNSFNGATDNVLLASSLEDATNLAINKAKELIKNNEEGILVSMGAGDVAKIGNSILTRLEATT